MHDTAFEIGSRFMALHAPAPACAIVELGAYDVNGTLRDAKPPHAVYLGLDVEHGPGVDLVVTPGAPLPLRSDFADLIITTSQMEHDPSFWTTFLELVRVLKPGGTLYFSAPSNGPYHTYPLDVWRFYPDAGLALARLGTQSGVPLTLIESFTAERKGDIWNDFVAVFRKGEISEGQEIPLLSDHFACTNLRTFRSDEVLRREDRTQDARIIQDLRTRIDELEAALAESDAQLAQVRSAQGTAIGGNEGPQSETDEPGRMALEAPAAPAGADKKARPARRRKKAAPDQEAEEETGLPLGPG